MLSLSLPELAFSLWAILELTIAYFYSIVHRAWHDMNSGIWRVIVETNTTILKAQHSDCNGMVNACKFSAKQEGRHAPISCGRASGLDYGVRKSVKYRRLLIIKTVKNSGKQRGIPLFSRPLVVQNSSISAAEIGSVAVNFREEQRKQRGGRAPHFTPKQCSAPGKRRARTSAAYSAAAAAISGASSA